jgi:hypothetical protein
MDGLDPETPVELPGTKLGRNIKTNKGVHR